MRVYTLSGLFTNTHMCWGIGLTSKRDSILDWPSTKFSENKKIIIFFGKKKFPKKN